MMLEIDRQQIKRTFFRALLPFVLVWGIYSCANIGRPDGGPYDELPPKFVKSSPTPGALNNSKKKVVIEFDEYIKLEKANEKVVVSPPQMEAPEIKPNGKKITINLLDSLKPNTTYTIDFSDAIVDNNEGNPLGNFAFTFSTGDAIDTLEVAGTVLDASNLEPVKGILVGLQSNLADSAFTRLPLERVARTDSRGHFTIRGVSPGTYRIYGLMDADQNFKFSQKSEMLAFEDSLIIPRFEERTRMDTVWKDTLTIDTIIEKTYTHYLPDHVILRAFKEPVSVRYFTKNERLLPQKFSFYFSAPSDSLPIIKGMNFDEEDAFLVEKSAKNDTIHYWIKDSLIYKRDTLQMSVNYLYTDTLGVLVPKTDTLNLATKKIKEPKKKKKKDDEPEPTKFLKVKTDAPPSLDVYRNIKLMFEEPLAYFDTAMIHLEQKVDTLWQNVDYLFLKDSTQLRKYTLLADWEPGEEYRFTVDSTAFHGLYGLFTDKIEQSLKVRKLDEYGRLLFHINGLPSDKAAVAELIDGQDKVVKTVQVVNGDADFYFLNPGKYYARVYVDKNGNGIWDTGLYETKLQPEEMYYYFQPVDVKVNWEIEQNWDVNSIPLDKQKPEELKKQKPDEDKKKRQDRQRNR